MYRASRRVRQRPSLTVVGSASQRREHFSDPAGARFEAPGDFGREPRCEWSSGSARSLIRPNRFIGATRDWVGKSTQMSSSERLVGVRHLEREGVHDQGTANTAGMTLVRLSLRNEAAQPGWRLLRAFRQTTESVNKPHKAQLDVERHRGRTNPGRPR